MGAEGESTETSVGEGVLINVRCSNGTKVAVRASLESTVGEFKEVVAQNCDVPAAQQRLIYKGRILKDDQTLHSYGLQADHTIHLVRGFAPSGSTHTTPSVNAPTGGNTNSVANVPGATLGAGTEGATGGAGLGASLFPGADFNFLGGNGNGNLGAGIPGLEQMQQQLNQNPNLMRDIMNTPAVQSLMNNPDLMRTMIMNNPQTREIIDRNPELAHILNDPSIIRQTLETARNPELMREMMRNTDRAMSNIESSPEGFNMLRRMYENVQEPFLNATAGGGGNDTSTNPFAALSANQGGGGVQTGSNVPNNGSDTTGAVPNSNPLPNPWGAPQTNTATRTPSNAPRTAGVGGLGGLGLPNLDPLSGGMPDPALMNQLLQNPAMSQMMQSVLSNPQHMNQLLNFNPQMRTMLDSNPQMREMMQNPEFLSQLTSPETMQQMMTLQQSLLPILNQQQGARGAGQAGDAAGLEMLMNMFGGLGTGGLNAPPSGPPEEVYATQLVQLQEMGFFDTQENIRALQATSGNVHAAVERLLNNLGQ
ncbi:unnamed protein product [Rhodiola kirilowii]